MIFIICIEPDAFYAARLCELRQALRLLFDKYAALTEVRYGLSPVSREDIRNMTFELPEQPEVSSVQLLKAILEDESILEAAPGETVCLILFTRNEKQNPALSDLAREAEKRNIFVRVNRNTRIRPQVKKKEKKHETE